MINNLYKVEESFLLLEGRLLELILPRFKSQDSFSVLKQLETAFKTPTRIAVVSFKSSL